METGGTEDSNSNNDKDNVTVDRVQESAIRGRSCGFVRIGGQRSRGFVRIGGRQGSVDLGLVPAFGVTVPIHWFSINQSFAILFRNRRTPFSTGARAMLSLHRYRDKSWSIWRYSGKRHIAGACKGS